MKTIRIKIALLSLLLCLPALLAWGAKDSGDYKLEKTETFCYSVKSRIGIMTLNMQHGDITLLTWDKDEVRLESKITVVAKDKKIAQKTFESRRVNVKHEEQKQNVTGEVWSNFELKCPTVSVDGKSVKQAKVEWTVYIPKNKTLHCEGLNLTSKFGSVDIPESLQIGSGCVNLMHGSMNINKIAPIHRTYICMQHSNMNIGSCEGRTELTLQHSNLNIGSAEVVDVNSEHTNFNVGGAKEMKCNAAHSNIKIGNLRKNELNLAHSNLEVKNAEEEVSLKSCAHSNIVFKSLVKGLNAGNCEHSSLVSTLTDAGAFTGFDVNAGFSRIQLIVPENLKAQCDISNVHGSIKMDVSTKKGKHIKGDHTNGFCTSYKGVIGTSTDAKPVIRITNRHGEIQIKD